MEAKTKAITDVPSIVLEVLSIWGAAIRKQRVAMGITAEDLCGRMSISRPTLRRMEHGDPAASAALYLAALNVLGILGQAAPRLEGHLWESATKLPRTRTSKDWRDEYF